MHRMQLIWQICSLKTQAVLDMMIHFQQLHQVQFSCLLRTHGVKQFKALFSAPTDRPCPLSSSPPLPLPPPPAPPLQSCAPFAFARIMCLLNARGGWWIASAVKCGETRWRVGKGAAQMLEARENLLLDEARNLLDQFVRTHFCITPRQSHPPQGPSSVSPPLSIRKGPRQSHPGPHQSFLVRTTRPAPL